MADEWRFFDSLRVVLQPDLVFSRMLLKRDSGAALGTMALSTGIMTVALLTLFKAVSVPSLTVPVGIGVTIVLSGWAMAVILCAAGSVLFDALYVVALKIDGQPPRSDRQGHWCCRACITPWWLLLFAILAWLPLPRISPAQVIVLIIVSVRMLDLEARLLVQVYRMPLLQAYVVVCTEAICIMVGVIISMRLPPLPAVPLPRMQPISPIPTP